MGKKQKRYIIVAPAPPKKSMGNRMLYKLYDVLRDKGYEAFMFCPNGHVPGYQYLETFDAHTRKSDVVVYSETVTGNPLKFKNVVRYVLYFPGKLGGETTYHPSENVFTWSKRYYPNAPELFLKWLDTSLFYDEGLPKTQDCYFVHKGGKYKELPELKGLTEINMTYPASRSELAQLLKTTGTLYSFDPDSAILTEAICCGAKAKVITEDGFRDVNFQFPFSNEQIEAQLVNFIKSTQEMNYQGPIQKASIKFTMKVYSRRALLAVYQWLNLIYRSQKLDKKISKYTIKLKERGQLGVIKN